MTAENPVFPFIRRGRDLGAAQFKLAPDLGVAGKLRLHSHFRRRDFLF